MKLLFVTLFGHGHLTPTLPLVEEVTRRGHEVWYATAAEHADAVTAAGARWLELPALPPFEPKTANPVDEWFPHYFAAMAAIHPVLLEHCRRDRPDVVCYDATNWPARVVARQLDIPAVRTVPHFVSNEHFRLMDPAIAWAVEEPCARFAAEQGVELDVASTLDAPEECSIVLVPREFQPAGDTFDETCHFVGPLLGRRLDEQWTPRHDLPLLYVSLGSLLSDEDFYRACVEQFGDGAWQVALSARADLGPLPDTIDVRPWFPQPAVLRHAAVFVTHGGMNSTMEALHAGVPLVVVPQTPEQVSNADHITALGLGERVHDLADLRAVVDRVATSDRIRRNVDRMRAAVRSGGGVQRAADLVLSRAPRAA
ncbi:macrolide family glycosyltransferase [Lentzea sp. NPDC042327]|uniref:macrolide family glycosyltransferase n=1 Tax=Lentzea sp. NPDC042327 TaxID=3154801 RepID=UPI00340C492B